MQSPNMNGRFEIRTVSGEILATDLTIEDLDAWWKENQDKFYGERAEGQAVIVKPW